MGSVVFTSSKGSQVPAIALEHTWTEEGSLGMKLTQVGDKPDSLSGVYVEAAAPDGPPAELTGLLLATVAGENVTKCSYNQVMAMLKDSWRPLTVQFAQREVAETAQCKWKICSHNSSQYQGDDSPFVAMYRDGQSHDALPITVAEDTAALPEGWGMVLDTALAQFCSKNDGVLGSLDELSNMCQSTHGQALFAPLLRMCDSEFPAVIRTRAAAMSQISQMTLGVMNVLPFGDSENTLVQAFARLAPLVFARDKKPAIDAAMATFVKPSADKPNLTIDRMDAVEFDPTGNIG